MRFAIFVDGPNLIGSLNKLQVDVDDYQAFYTHVVENALEAWKECLVSEGTPLSQLLRVFWYQVGHMDEINFSNPGLEENLRKIFENSKDINKGYMALAGKENPGKSHQELKDIAWEKCFSEGKAWYEAKQKSLENMKKFNHSVRGNTNFIEIVESGHWKIDLLRKRVTEKGIDTSLAVDLVTVIESYDVALVISGDADMIPSINYAKQRGKHVGVIDIINGYPPERKGRQSSTRLKSHSDFIVPVYEMELVSKKIANKRQENANTYEPPPVNRQ